MEVPSRTSKFCACARASPVTVVILEINGSPNSTARCTATAVPTFEQTTPTSAGSLPLGTCLPVRISISCFSPPEGYLVGDNLVGALAHQDVIGGDIRLAFSAIDDQCFYARRAGLDPQLYRGRKASAAHASNTGIADKLQQFDLVQGTVIIHSVVLYPLVGTVTGEHNTRRSKPGGVGNQPIFNG